MFYAPKLIKPETKNDFVSQIDIYPTLMHLLNISFTNNTEGINVLKEKREYSFFSGDSEYGVINDKWYFIGGKKQPAQLYKYTDKNQQNLAEQYPEIVTEMQTYGESYFQVYQYLTEKKLQNL